MKNCQNVQELCLWPQCHHSVTLNKEDSYKALQRSAARSHQYRLNAK